MKKIILLTLLVSVVIFCFACQENSSESDNLNFENKIKVTGQIVSSDSTSLLDSVQIMLVGESTYTDTTDDQVFFKRKILFFVFK